MVQRQKRKTKAEIEEVLNKIHSMRVLGAAPSMIMRELKISERNYYDTYLPRLNKKWKETWERKTPNDLYSHAQEYGEQLNSCYTNARAKAREPNANAAWGLLEQELGLLLFQYNREGPVIVEKLRQLEQKTTRLDESDERKPIILRDQSDSNQDDGSDSSTTESDTSQRKF